MHLVCEYGIGTDDHGMVFQVIGCCYRLIRLLGLCENTHDISQCSAEDKVRIECERRLVWSNYILDNSVAAGVSANISWTSYPAIPLPISDETFLARIFPPQAPLMADEAFANITNTRTLNLRSNTIHLVNLRFKVLR